METDATVTKEKKGNRLQPDCMTLTSNSTTGGDNEMKVPNTNENMEKCICGSCPTFTQNSLIGGFFCAMGKSEKVPEMKGCNCADCPLWAEYDLSKGYFCIHGASE